MHWKLMSRYAITLVFVLQAQGAHGIEEKQLEGVVLGFPALTLASTGETIAQGRYEQWAEQTKLNIRITYDFKDGRTAVESVSLEQEPELKQNTWSWIEKQGDLVIREFDVDFVTHQARARKIKDPKKGRAVEYDSWSERLDGIVAGQSFAGTGISIAVKNLADRILRGEKVLLKVVAFTTKPRAAEIEIRDIGKEKLTVAAQTITASHLRLHPRVPAIAKLFVTVKDIDIWITDRAPYQILRFQGPLQEPKDPIVSLNIYPAQPKS